MLKILNSICNEIAKRWANAPIYVEGVPSNFARPSFYVQFLSNDPDILTRDAREDVAAFQVVHFAEVNDFLEPRMEKRLEGEEILREVFGSGVLPIVGTNRAAKITAYRSEGRDSEVYVALTVSLCGLRVDTAPALPYVQNVHMREV